MSIYEFNKEDAFRFANFVGIQANQRGDELIFKQCPYCKSNTNKKDKFAINLDDGRFNCFRASCGAKGNMITLSRDFNFKLSEDVDRYYNRDNHNDKFRKFKEYRAEVKEPAVAYCKKRGISKEIVEKYEITTRSDADNILVFPFKNEDGELKFIKYRKMDYDKNKDKAKEWCEKDCMPILFGMNHCEDRGTLVITEGQMDSLAVAESGVKNAVSVPIGCNGFTWLPHCWNFIHEFDKIVVFGDCENGKVTLAETLTKRLKKNVLVVQIDDYKGEKDANDILLHHGKEAVKNAIYNATAPLSERVKDMSEIEWVDLSKMDKISTGMRMVDAVIGGLYEGQVILLTGERGNGKSTLANQLILEGLSQDKNCFIYSGELPNFFVKAWIDTQLIGRGNGNTTLYNSDIDICNAFYRNRLFIYDNSIVDSEEKEDLIATLEDTIIKKDIKLAVIDNLMEAIDCDVNSDLYRAQSKFVGRLAKLTKTYNMTIILVAHPRKRPNGIAFTNDDVSGSADITNRVDVVMSYDKWIENGEEEKDARRLSITKNRLTGIRGEVKLFFEFQSRRISDCKNFAKGWIDEGFKAVDTELEEVPF